jgi:acyl-CoA thioesterase YciA
MPETSSPTPRPDAQQLSPTTLPEDRQLVLRVMPMPADANGNGDIFGGWIMAQVDLAGAVIPARIAKGRIATVAVNQFIFKQPVSVGDLLSFYAKVERVGTTSITVHVEVYAERNPANLQVVKVTEANLTYVAIDMQGQPRKIPRD